MSQRKNVFDSHSETEQIVWHRCPLMQVSLYHHQLTQQFVAHVCTVWPYEQSTGAELDQGTMASKPFVTHSLQHDGA